MEIILKITAVNFFVEVYFPQFFAVANNELFGDFFYTNEKFNSKLWLRGRARASKIIFHVVDGKCVQWWKSISRKTWTFFRKGRKNQTWMKLALFIRREGETLVGVASHTYVFSTYIPSYLVSKYYLCIYVDITFVLCR